jgi:hypothetical protein
VRYKHGHAHAKRRGAQCLVARDSQPRQKRTMSSALTRREVVLAATAAVPLPFIAAPVMPSPLLACDCISWWDCVEIQAFEQAFGGEATCRHRF